MWIVSFSPKQQEYLHQCDHRWNIKVGATGSGKSGLDYAVVIPKRIIATQNEGAIVMLGNTRGTLCRNIIDPMRDIWGETLVSGLHSDSTLDLFGKKVHILGADNKKHVARIQGMTIEYAYGDEMTTWSEDVFQMLKSRLRCEHSIFDGTCNPDAPSNFVKKFLDSNADTFCQTSTIDDNPFLPRDFVAELKKEYAGTVYYDRFILGRWALAEGRIYDMFDKTKHVADASDRAYTAFYISVDYGTQNPTAMLLWGKFKGVWYLVKEYYYSGREEKRQKTDEEYYSDLRDFAGDRHINAVVIDPSAASMIACIRNHGRFTVRKAHNEVLDGIRNTASAINSGKIKICENCTNTLKEFELYVWDSKAAESGEDRPVKENDHAMDAMRYFVQTVLSTGKVKVGKRPY